MIISVLWFIIWLALLIPSIAVAVRQLHDTSRRGWWILLALVPYLLVNGADTMGSEELALVGAPAVLVALVAWIVFCVLDGTPGPNRFGEDPKGCGTGEIFA